jgi:hypothetical protein
MEPGGTQGGTGAFFGGIALMAIGAWLLFDSVQMVTGMSGWFSGMLGAGRGGLWTTTSMGIIFVPFLAGIFILFFDAKAKWAWWLTIIGLLVVIIEILSRIQFVMNSKTSHVLLMLAMIAGGAGLVLKGYRTQNKK